MKTKLSDRVRPNCEAAPWVIDEIKKLEQQIEQMQPIVDAYMRNEHCPHGVYWHACGDPKCANVGDILNEKPSMKNYKLCYIANNFAYFTTQDLDKQWGDDWNDAPYEHNAGAPYEPSIRYYADGRKEKFERDWNEDGTPKWEILKVAFDTRWYVETPAETAGSNSMYSVQMINNKLIPWLVKYPDKELFAGASVEEFITFIEECGGTVYLPKSKDLVFYTNNKEVYRIESVI